MKTSVGYFIEAMVAKRIDCVSFEDNLQGTQAGLDPMNRCVVSGMNTIRTTPITTSARISVHRL